MLGLEAAELRLVEQWCSEGVLPFLGSLLAACPLVSLHTPIYVLQIAVWPSILTGASAGRHGQYVLWKQIKSGSYEMAERRAPHGSQRRYFELLEDRGVTCAVADIPADVRIPGFRGMQIVDWGTEYRFGGVETEPRGLASRIRREIGDYPIPHGRRSGDSQQEHLELARLLDEGARRKGALVRWLLRQRELDHVFCVFSEMHKGAHWLWKYMDSCHVDYEESPDSLRDALKHICQCVDQELGTIAGQLQPQDNLVVLSDHGMQANYRGDHLAGPFLEALGLLVRDGPSPLTESVLPRGGARGRRAGRPSLLRRASAAAKDLVPAELRAHAKAYVNRQDIDWRRTRVFTLPTDRNT